MGESKRQANEAIPLYNKPQHEYQLSYISRDESKAAYLRSIVDLTTTPVPLFNPYLSTDVKVVSFGNTCPNLCNT